MRKKIARWTGIVLLSVSFAAGALLSPVPAKEQTQEDPAKQTLDDITVRGKKTTENIEIEPGQYEINLGDYKKAGVSHTIYDVLRDRAIIDYRGTSTLSPESDELQMRGFDTRQFTTAIDGVAIQKTGGRWGGHFTDFRSIPMEQIESIEILPGAHSALYEGKSFGGVINIKTKSPVWRDDPEVEFRSSASYASKNTYDTSLTASGGGGAMDYVLGVREFHTDGHLKNNEYDQSTMSARMAWLLPNNGHISLMGSYSGISREIPSENDPDGSFYDSSYPVVETEDVSGRWKNPAGNARRTKRPHDLHFSWKQPSELGKWTLSAYYGYDNQKYQYDLWDEPMQDTEWKSYGGKIQNEFHLTDDHQVTVGFDTAILNEPENRDIVRTYAGFIQDKWQATPRLTIRPGLRYEKVDIWWNNKHVRTDEYAIPEIEKDYIEKNYDDLMPKLFATYQLDDFAKFLRDTSVSAGVSRIWSPRATCEV